MAIIWMLQITWYRPTGRPTGPRAKTNLNFHFHFLFSLSLSLCLSLCMSPLFESCHYPPPIAIIVVWPTGLDLWYEIIYDAAEAANYFSHYQLTKTSQLANFFSSASSFLISCYHETTIMNGDSIDCSSILYSGWLADRDRFWSDQNTERESVAWLNRAENEEEIEFMIFSLLARQDSLAGQFLLSLCSSGQTNEKTKKKKKKEEEGD